MTTVLLLKILLGVAIYTLVTFFMIKVEYVCSQINVIFPNKRKIIPFQDVKKFQRSQDRSWV